MSWQNCKGHDVLACHGKKKSKGRGVLACHDQNHQGHCVMTRQSQFFKDQVVLTYNRQSHHGHSVLVCHGQNNKVMVTFLTGLAIVSSLGHNMNIHIYTILAKVYH